MKKQMMFGKKGMKTPNPMKGKSARPMKQKGKSMAHLYDDMAPKHMKK